MIFRKQMHRRVLLTSMLALTLAACGGGGSGSGGGGSTPTPTPTPTPSPTPSPSLQAVTTADLGNGWNLGNSLDALNNSNTPHTSSQETYWGNPAVNQQLLNAIAAAGFKSVRIPVSWMQYADSSGNISPAFIARVTEVVNYARNAGLYVIINQHHGDWQAPTTANQAAANATFKTLWTQVANNFKNYDNHLLFAGTNEIHVDYNVPTAEYCTVQTGFNQVFVDAVRATGGNNASRTLVVQGYNTDAENTINVCGAKVPTDTTAGRLMMEFHYYGPWNFAGNDSSSIWQWGAIATDPAATESGANEPYVDALFDKVKAAFADKGIPVIIGEYGAISKTEYDPAMKYRNYWDQYITASAKRHGFAPFYWDNGYPDNHQFGLFNRSTGAQYYPTTINLIVTAQ